MQGRGYYILYDIQVRDQDWGFVTCQQKKILVYRGILKIFVLLSGKNSKFHLKGLVFNLEFGPTSIMVLS